MARGNKYIARDLSFPYRTVLFTAAVPLIQAAIIMTRRGEEKERQKERTRVALTYDSPLNAALLFDYERHELNEYVHET